MDLYMDSLLEIDEENFANEWRLEEIDNKMKPFRVVLKEALAVARREEEKYFSIESNSNVKDPGEKAFPDLVPKKLEFGEPPEAVFQWFESWDLFLKYAHPSKVNNLPWVSQRMYSKLDSGWIS